MRKQFFPSDNSVSLPWLRFALVAGVTVAMIATASARYRHRGSAPEKREKIDEQARPAGPLFFVISVGKQHVSVYGNNGLYARSPISTGRPDHPTPMGIFNILQKERYHRSNIYSGAPMPFMQRITYSGVAMHEGYLPGYAASHGCIRMPHDFASRMFNYTQGNERVIITRQDIVPASFSHPRLPVPKLVTAPGSDNIASGASQILQNALSATDLSRRSEKVDVSVKADGSEGAAPRLLNPLEFAKSMKAQAAKRAEDAAAAVNPAHNAIEAKTREAKAAAIELRKAELALANAKGRFDVADRQLQKVSGDEAVTAATAARDAVSAKLKEAEALVEAAKNAKAEKDQDAAAAVSAFDDLDNTRKAAAAALKSWNRRLAPISVLISRKERRLYVRQGFVKVFDVPVTIRDPEKPLGTHLYMAMQPVEENAGAAPALRWLVLTIPDAATGDADRSRSSRRHRNRNEDDDAPRVALPSSSASAALDRIEVPAEVSEKISEMLWAGGSLIVSDTGISRETSNYDGTDFIVLTR